MVLKYFSNPVKCGFPSPAMDYMEESIDLNELLIKNRPSTFIVENIGDSMVDAFIPPHFQATSPQCLVLSLDVASLKFTSFNSA